MFTDIVNNITFDINCESEAVLPDLQREISSYSLPLIHTVFEKVLSIDTHNGFSQIGKIEVNLGNVALEEVTKAIEKELENALSARIRNAAKTFFKYPATDEFAGYLNQLAEGPNVNGYEVFLKLVEASKNPSTTRIASNSAKLNLPAVSHEVSSNLAVRSNNAVRNEVENGVLSNNPGYLAGNTADDIFSQSLKNHPLKKPAKSLGNFSKAPGKGVHNEEEHYSVSYEASGNAHNELNTEATEVFLIILKQLILTGDLPWWVDKSTGFDPNKVLQLIISSQQEIIDLFFREVISNSSVNKQIHPINTQINTQINKQAVHRIKAFFSPVTLSMLKVLVPEISGLAQQAHGDAPTNNGVDLYQLLNLNYSAKSVCRDRFDVIDNVKSLMIEQAVRRLNLMRFPFFTSFEFFSPDELSIYRSLTDGDLLRTSKLMEMLKRLSIERIEFLFQLTAYRNRHEGNVTSSSPAAERHISTSYSEAKTDRIKFLLEVLGSSSNILEKELQNLPAVELQTLEHTFKAQLLNRNITHRLAELLAEHPYFIKYNLLQLPFHFDTHSIANKKFKYSLGVYKVSLKRILKKLPVEEDQVLDEVFQSGSLKNEFAKQTVLKVLRKLPRAAISVLSKIALSNENDVQSLARHIKKGTTASKASEISNDSPFLFRQTLEKIVIENAGLCLVAQYLPALFRNLNYLDKKEFKSPLHRHRALFILHYLASEKQRAPEYVMQFNKVLCGLDPQDVISGAKRLVPVEKVEADSLLSSVIENWQLLKGTSIKGFRDSFLRRKGLLFQDEKIWTLQVEKKGYDVLIDSLPWSFNLIKLPWMNKELLVEW